jgi:hypothetical protein
MKYVFEVEDGGRLDALIKEYLSLKSDIVEREKERVMIMGMVFVEEERKNHDPNNKELVAAFGSSLAFLKIVTSIREYNKKIADNN